ncbi:hypothetical protein ACFFGH_19985 [Lysobacter korlensis]|uniref:Translocase n=1 Tax=Lysobacter korlensis TaxID=553636 RepID=A0ABV6RT08_9GAMM
MGGLTMEKLFVIAVIAVFLVGPERVPHYAYQLGRLTKQAKSFVGQAKARAAEELGPDFDVDWKQLDPRQYDPRRIIREALTDDPAAAQEPGRPATAADEFDPLPVPKPPSSKTGGLALGGGFSRPARKPNAP